MPRALVLILAVLTTSTLAARPAPAASAPATGRAGPPVAAIASAHPLATAAGMEILRAGGNAFDAAVAVAAALAVVEPYSSGLGGGGFWLLHRARDGHEVMVDGRERAPGAAHRDMYLDAAGRVIPGASMDGPLAAAIPGEPAALAYLAEGFGRLSLERSLGPAIRLAEEGFPVDPVYRRMAAFRLEALRASPATRKIAAAAGGIWSRADLEEYQAVERTPLRGRYGEVEITTVAPPSSGGVVLLEMLNILSGYDLQALGEVDRVHLEVEAMRRAYRDRAEYLGDPDYVDVPVARLIHPWYAAGLRASIRRDRATPSAELPGFARDAAGPHTTHYSIVDGEGNRVAATLSINYPFGSAFVAPGTGVLLNDEMDDFSARPGAPNAYGLVGAEANAIAPGKRPLSSMTPTFVSGPRGDLVLGTPGGSRIITMVLLGILEHVRGGALAEVVSRPRYHHQYLPDVVQFEPGALTPEVQAGLERRGHRLQVLEAPYGNMQAVYRDRATGRVTAASDPRGIGAAAVEGLAQPASTSPVGE